MSYKKREQFYGTEKARVLLAALEELVANPNHETTSTYAADIEKYPEHRISFSDKHMSYIDKHPEINLSHYIANLRLITKKR